jgi:hypothetical protein
MQKTHFLLTKAVDLHRWHPWYPQICFLFKFWLHFNESIVGIGQSGQSFTLHVSHRSPVVASQRVCDCDVNPDHSIVGIGQSGQSFTLHVSHRSRLLLHKESVIATFTLITPLWALVSPGNRLRYMSVTVPRLLLHKESVIATLTLITYCSLMSSFRLFAALTNHNHGN